MADVKHADLRRFGADALLGELVHRCEYGVQLDARTFLRFREKLPALAPTPPRLARNTDDWLLRRLREAIASGDRRDIAVMLDVLEHRLSPGICHCGDGSHSFS